MKTLFTFLFFALLGTFCLAQNFKQVKIHLNSDADIITLAQKGIDIEHSEKTKDNHLILFLSDEEYQSVLRSGFVTEVIIDDWFEYYNSLPALDETDKSFIYEKSRSEFGIDGFEFGSMGGYYTYQEVVNELDSMFALYPNIITQKFSIGTSIEGRTIWAVKISDNPNVFENEPGAGYDALIHAREPQSMATLMYFMYYLLENYGTNPEVTYLVNNRQIFCVPVYNPDGYEYNRSTNPGGGGMWRKNRRNSGGGDYGVDLNRNYGFAWGYDNTGSSPDPGSETYRGSAAFSEPEVQALRDFVVGKNIYTYFNMHTYQNALLYPWGYIDAQTPDSLIYYDYASSICSYNGYAFGTGSEILGYNSNGASRDWLYGDQVLKNKIFGYTIEIGSSSDGFWPSQSRIFPLAQINVKSMLYNTWVAGEYIELENANFAQPYFNPGDVVQLSPSFKNSGQATGNNISVELTSLSVNATIINGSAQFDSIQSRQSVSVTSPFSFSISGNAGLEENIKLLISVSTGGVLMSADTVSIMIGTPNFVFADTTNNPLTLWTIAGSPVSSPKWEATTSSFYSSPNSYTDSRTGNYVNNATVTMTLTNTVNLTGVSNPRLTFWTKYAIENDWDYGQVEISTNNGTTWTALQGQYTNPGTGSFQPNGQPLYDGTMANWVKEEISLSSNINQQVKLRFKLRTDGSTVADGWYVDDVAIVYYTIVPVELSSFTALSTKESIELQWQTSTEKNNQGFEIQKSQTSNVKGQTDWKTIGFIEGNGTTSELHSYRFIDNNPVFGKNSYRLKQIDYDGTYKVYGPVEADFNVLRDFSLEQNYPNPFNPVTKIRYTVGDANYTSQVRVQLTVYDILGRVVTILVDENKSAGNYDVAFNATDITSGIYYYEMKAGNFIQTKKMVVLK